MLRIIGARVELLFGMNAGEVEAGLTANAELEAKKQARRLDRKETMMDINFLECATLFGKILSLNLCTM